MHIHIEEANSPTIAEMVVEMAKPEQSFDELVAKQVAKASRHEDMRSINEADLKKTSRFVYVARNLEGYVAVGHLRQLPPLKSGIIVQNSELQVSELGSMWVHTSHRNRGVASKMIRAAMLHGMAEGHVPLAICNPHGAGAFSNAGFEAVGILPPDKKAERTVMMAQPAFAEGISDWPQVRREVVVYLRDLTRFEDLSLSELTV